MKRSLSDTELLRAQELLVLQATEGLAADEAAELERLGAAGIDEVDRAAAAVAVATVPREAMPAHVKARLFAATAQNGSTAPAVPAVAAYLPESPRARATARRRWRPDPRLVGGLLAAAGLALAIGAGVMTWSRPRGEAPAAAPIVTRAELARTTDDLVETAWRGTTPGLAGTAAWSTARQRGVIELSGLPELRADQRFQIWLYDRGRDARYPIDGGLFARAATGPTEVVITPLLPVEHLEKLEITVEDARGVVVSDRAQVVATAELSAQK